MLKWSEAFATGARMVDMQHRMLVDKINDMEKLLSEPVPSKAACDDLLNFLASYIVSHFKSEERCMRSAHCPVHEKNHEAHQAFLRGFARFKQRYQAEGPTRELLQSFHTTTANWIQEHILTIDIQLRACSKK